MVDYDYEDDYDYDDCGEEAMSVLSVVLYPDDPLTKVAAPIEHVGPKVRQLVEDMFETMYEYEGVGLAGPQVGVAKRIFVLHEPDGAKMCLINPELSELEGQEDGQEGCLSLPEIYVQVPRATRLRVRALDETGARVDFEAEGFLARIIQHEYDHLNGTIMLDRVDVLTRHAKLQEWDDVRGRLLAVRG
ncbi:MAG: peptide deformylase [Candidatus Hydrogenedentes bacterium]|nr:peptide deformylase [Candidatus Hydrogenedentota bacterium]